MSQTETEQQLRIWKDLAIGKQVLMNEAASALKLTADFTAEELREALDQAVKRARDADADILSARNRATAEIGTMQGEVKKTEKARLEAERQRDEAIAGREAAEQALATGRQDNAEAIKKAKRDVENKQRELKAINTALADTPENILKKLKTLKKQKLDEAAARKTAEDANRKLRKESKEQKDELETLEGLKEKAATLLAGYRELEAWAVKKSEAAGKSGDDSTDGKASDKAGDKADEEGTGKAPLVDAKLVSDIETLTAAADEEDADQKGKSGTRKNRKSREAVSA